MKILRNIKISLKKIGFVVKFYKFLQKYKHEFMLCFPTWAVKSIYKSGLGKYPDLKNPRTINEKLQVLKLGKYYNNDLITACVDKYEVKKLLETRFATPGLKFAKTYAFFDSVDELLEYGFDQYPERFVIKCNHGCGYNYLCEDKSKINVTELKKLLTRWLQEDMWKIFAEYQYRFVKKKIFVEQFLPISDAGTYKIYCFHGEPKFLYVSGPDEQGNADIYLDFFDMDFNHLPVTLCGHLHSPIEISKPQCFDRMIEIAKHLSKDFPFVRVDLYEVNDEIYFSEFTFFPTGGYMNLTPKTAAEEWGDLLKL